MNKVCLGNDHELTLQNDKGLCCWNIIFDLEDENIKSTEALKSKVLTKQVTLMTVLKGHIFGAPEIFIEKEDSKGRVHKAPSKVSNK